MSNIISINFRTKQLDKVKSEGLQQASEEQHLTPQYKMRWSKDEIAEAYEIETCPIQYNLQNTYDYDSYWLFEPKRD